MRTIPSHFLQKMKVIYLIGINLFYFIINFFRLSDTNKSATLKQDKKKAYDILILDKNSDMEDYDTSVSMLSNRNNSSFRRSKNIEMILDTKIGKYNQGRYKPFTLRNYTKSSPTGMVSHTRSGGLGPEIGGKKWQQEKAKRDRMRDFSERINRMKKDDLIMNTQL